MGYKFSKISEQRLSECHPDLQKVLREAIKQIDFSVLVGYRNEEDQNQAFADGKSKLLFPASKHNKFPSMAVDIIPCPIDWKDTKRLIFLMGIVKGIASQMNIKLRFGVDFNRNNDVTDDNFFDGYHLELED